MARSNKPILWLPFAGGGLVAALITPVLILITGVLVPLGVLHLHYETIVGVRAPSDRQVDPVRRGGAAGLACRASAADDGA